MFNLSIIIELSIPNYNYFHHFLLHHHTWNEKFIMVNIVSDITSKYKTIKYYCICMSSTENKSLILIFRNPEICNPMTISSIMNKARKFPNQNVFTIEWFSHFCQQQFIPTNRMIFQSKFKDWIKLILLYKLSEQ